MKRIIVGVALSLALGCATPTTSIEQKAAFDLECPAEQIEVTDLGSGSFDAIGCGKRVSYACFQNTWGYLFQCVKN